MRADIYGYDLTVPATITDALAMLAEGRHTPIAGGTELMVALSAGRLPRKPLLSVRLKELRFIEVQPGSITIGAGATFSDLRRHPVIASDFPLLSDAASWIGSIANQNRATIGGNIVNASPAADSPPALLAYDATLTIISAAGERTLAYRDFHLGYKKVDLRPGELLYSIHFSRTYKERKGCIRKVGTRNAQAISKVALASLALLDGNAIQDIRIAAASLREIPARLTMTEQALIGKRIDAQTIAAARAALLSEVHPIDDIRSTASYRAAVGANLLEDFLRSI